VPLLYLPDGEDLVVVASGGGPDREPPWVLNLLAGGPARAQIGGEVREVRAELARGEERTRLWPALTRMFLRWGEMQTQTTRELSVILLRPVAPKDGGTEVTKGERAATPGGEG